jgi:tight adherence protein C
MNPAMLVVACLLCLLALAGGAWPLLHAAERQQRWRARVQLCRGEKPAAHGGEAAKLRRVLTRAAVALGRTILRSGVLPAKTRAELEATLSAGGLAIRNAVEVFICVKLALFAAGPALMILLLSDLAVARPLRILLPAAAALGGLMLPDAVVRLQRRRYLRRVEQGLPDALDLLVICLHAGLGLTAAIGRVAEELHAAGQTIGREMALTATELKLLSDSRQALMNLAGRTRVPGLERMATTLVQSIQYGTPLAEALRVLASELRDEMLTRFESRAARVGVLLTVPMVLFILPCVFLVVGGPAIVRVMQIRN